MENWEKDFANDPVLRYTEKFYEMDRLEKMQY